MKKRENTITLDIVIPVYNESEVLDELFERLRTVFGEDSRKDNGLTNVRYIFIDDGSTDQSAEMIARALSKGLEGVLLRFSRNFGHQSAITAGLDSSSGDIVAIIDADLQDPPEVILEMLELWRKGYDVVYGQRQDRKENFIKRLGYWGFYRIVRFLSSVSVPLDCGDFCVMDRRVVDTLGNLPEKLRFPRGLRAFVGFNQIGVTYSRPARFAGQPKYTLARLYRLATDGIASLSIVPLRAAQLFAFSYFVLAFLVALAAVFSIFFSWKLPVDLPILVGFVIILCGLALQLFCSYILGAYVGRTYLEVKGRPPYIVMEKIITKSEVVTGSSDEQ